MNIFDVVPISTLNYFNDGSIILLDKMDGYYLVNPLKIRKLDRWITTKIRLEECGLNGNVSFCEEPKEYSFKEFLELGPHKVRQRTPMYF